MDRPALGAVEDLAELANLDEEILLAEIKERYSRNKIYTYVGDILIAVNPFKDIGIYGKDESQRYRMSKKTAQPPHIFAVSDAAYQALLGHGGRPPGNQCILISGESGAGKTESTKLIIKQLVELCKGNTQLERQILQVNPLLEAFGNAQTVMNDNSSRFGKYIQLRFHSGQLIGGKISEYLLEKSRVVRQNEGEENFHIFSYLFAGVQQADPEGRFALQDPSQYRYMCHGARRLKNNLPVLHECFEELVNAMDMVGFTDDDQQDLFTVIAAILHLGNVVFELDDYDAAMVTDPNGAVKIAAKLLGVDSEEVASCLTSLVTVTRGEYVKRAYSVHQAQDARDAMTKAVYGRLFGWIVNKINQLLAPEIDVDPHLMTEIGILDIFGFEHFEKNSFEQACINLANEQLQFFFNQHIFKMEQEEYMKEGIDWTEIKFVDNKPLLDLFLTKPIGMLALLDEESLFPKGTDQSYVDKLNSSFRKNQYFTKSPQTTTAIFCISHYAGKVTYQAEGWLEKNRDTMPAGIIEVLQSSTNALVKTVFRAQITRTGSLALQGRRSTGRVSKGSRQRPIPSASDGAKRKLTVGAQFKTSLSVLMERMTAATPIFVRCLKPNHLKTADNFDEKYIQSQLLYTGMLETTKIRREGYAVRPTFEDFVSKYKILMCRLDLKGSRDNCVKILQASKMTRWHIGKSKVFLKYHHVEQLTDILDNLGKKVVVLQKIARGFIARRQYARKLEKARQEKARLEALMKAAQQAALAEEARLKLLKQKGNGHVNGQAPPPVPPFTYEIPGSKQLEYMKPKKKTATTGTQVEGSDSSDSEVLEDDFKPVNSNLNKFGRPGTKKAAAEWFKQTQTEHVMNPTNTRFAEWFHGIISRKESERLLKDKIIGSFLIRVSESRFGYTLSFKDKNRVRHYMIDQLKNGKFIIIGEPKVHRTLHTLIAYHRKVKISNWEGLLTVPCGQNHGECDYIDLVSEQMYFVLEPETGAGPNPYLRTQAVSGPELPPRSYSERNSTELKADFDQDDKRESKMDGRPLPKIPEEAYNRLIENQPPNPKISRSRRN
ncbi:myosin-IIIb-like isoform X2 [Littorina saxatilis]|uniref:Uncharacterized protein n=1 Tax=Littorina saxatilis TaxID=31220 RepID=A0AAN9C1M0_9CAEN